MSLCGYNLSGVCACCGAFLPKEVSYCSFNIDTQAFFPVVGRDQANSLCASQQDVNGLGRDFQHFCYCQGSKVVEWLALPPKTKKTWI